MTAIAIRLPNSVHESIKQLARKDGISVNQFIASAASKKMASFQTLDFLRREAALIEALEDTLFGPREQLGEAAFPKGAPAYLNDWAAPERGWRRQALSEVTARTRYHGFI